MIIDDVDLYTAGLSKAKRASDIHAVLGRLTTGDDAGADSRNHRVTLAYLLSATATLRDASSNGVHCDAGGQMFSIMVDPSRPHGVFDAVPDGYASASDFAAKLISCAAANHGHAMTRFLSRLVQWRSDDEPALRLEIEKSVHLFQRNARIDPNSGIEMRVSEAFGLVYAAMQLAVRARALPKDFEKSGSAILKCFKMHQASKPDLRSPLEKLLEIADDPTTVQLASKRAERKEATKTALQQVPVFIINKGSQRRLMFFKAAFNDKFVDHRAFLRDPAIVSIQVREKANATCKVDLTPTVRDRLYCFDLPPASAK